MGHCPRCANDPADWDCPGCDHEAEITRLKTLGTVEMMLENVNIDSFVREKEREIVQLQERVDKLEEVVAALTWVDHYGVRWVRGNPDPRAAFEQLDT